MDSNLLPASVDMFVRRYMTSINHLEVLMRLARAPSESFSVGDIVESMSIETATARTVLEELAGDGLVTRQGDGYGLGAPAGDLSEAISELEAAYDRFPVQLIRIIYDAKRTPVQSFADAFKLRKE